VSRVAHCGSILHFRADPGAHDSSEAFEYWEQGALIVAGGHIEAVGPASALLREASGELTVIEHGNGLIMPGFIDTHIHYVQTDVIASGGKNLLEWLERYTYPAEQRFADPKHAHGVAEFFLDELLRNGTTTAQVLGTVHKSSVDAFFEAAAARGMRMIAGKTLMDRNCPTEWFESPAAGEREMRELIERWHGRDRLHYAITPRFAPTSSVAQLESAGRLARAYPDVFIHSHLAETRAEIDWVRELFPDTRSYLDVYDRFGLLRERATYAHCIYLDEADRRRLAASGAGAAFAPSSNLYLGSGLFDLEASDAAGMRYALATDVGGGSSFSMLRTMAEAYKVAHLLGQSLTPLRAFYLSTLAGARLLGLADKIGHFIPGGEADFIVLDPQATPLLARRTAQARTLSERLLLYMILGDDRAIAATFILGQHAQPRGVKS
jgi:guanine deaminase